MEKGLTKNQILSELSRSSHGALNEYLTTGRKATEQEPEFMAHLIAWNQKKGQIRDSKVALPIVSLTVPKFPEELVSNSYAHLASQGPRELLKGYRFALELKHQKVLHWKVMKEVMHLVHRWLSDSEQDPKSWNYLALQHRRTLKALYATTKCKPAPFVQQILFKNKYPKGSVFEKVSQLHNMSAQEAAGVIIARRIPFLVALGALGSKAKDPDLVLALINSMSPTELITNVKMLEGMGMKTNPALRGAFEKATEKASASTKNVLKTTRAAEQIEDKALREKLRGVQERQLSSMAVQGNWLVLGDKSGSMNETIEVAREVAATLAKMVKDKVWLVFFDVTPQTIDVTGCSLDIIKKATQHVVANGGTSIGCGLLRMLESKIEVDGIAIVSDAQENSTPYFADVYKKYSEVFDKSVPVYLYRTRNTSHYYADRDLKSTMSMGGHDLQEFDLTGKIDYYSLPNLVATMRTNRYSLIDEVMSTPLLSLEKVLKPMRKEESIHA